VKRYGGRRIGRLGSVSWDLGQILRPTFHRYWELESMGASVGIGNGHSDDLVCIEVKVPTVIVRRINRMAGYG
jgi:hypothetical protein